MDSKTYNIEYVNHLLTLSSDELLREIQMSSISNMDLALQSTFGISSNIESLNGLGLYLFSKYISISNLIGSQKKKLKAAIEKRTNALRHDICTSDILRDFIDGKSDEAQLAIGIAAIIAGNEGMNAEISLLLAVYLLKKGVFSYCDRYWTL